MKKITLLLALTAIALITFAQGPYTIPYSTDFENYTTQNEFEADWTYEINTDGLWMFDSSAYFGVDTSNAPVYGTGNKENGDDWLFSPGFQLEAGISYKLSFKFAMFVFGKKEKMAVSIGTGPRASVMTDELVDLGTFTNYFVDDNGFVLSGVNFTVPATGVYHIGFQALSSAANGGIVVDDFSVSEYNAIEGIDEININIYPNPTTDVLNIEGIDNASVFVYNSLGQEVITKTNVSRINLSELPEGTYILKVFTDNGIATKKIILTK